MIARSSFGIELVTSTRIASTKIANRSRRPPPGGVPAAILDLGSLVEPIRAGNIIWAVGDCCQALCRSIVDTLGCPEYDNPLADWYDRWVFAGAVAGTTRRSGCKTSSFLNGIWTCEVFGVTCGESA